MVPQQTAKFSSQYHIFWSISYQFEEDSVANYGLIWALFSPSVRGLHVLCNELNVS